MNFKKPKDQVIDEAHIAASNMLYSAFSNLKYNYSATSHNSILDVIQGATDMAIREAIRSLVNNIYTDQEFEEDVGLRDKT